MSVSHARLGFSVGGGVVRGFSVDFKFHFLRVFNKDEVQSMILSEYFQGEYGESCDLRV